MKKTFIVVALLLMVGFLARDVYANHAWGKYHWDLSTADTKADPLDLGDNVSSEWDASLVQASFDWNQSVLKNEIVGGHTDPASCDPTYGGVEVCNYAYGNNGWLGIASIWATRGKSNHIVQGVVMLNDYYFAMDKYNAQAWRDLVTCQEIGHTFGLDHQDEIFDNPNLGTCMDYTSDPDGTILNQKDNTRPNAHDYEMLTEMYAHLNDTSGGTGGSGNGNGKGKKPGNVGANIDLTNPSAWGEAVSWDALGRASAYERVLANGHVLVTHVLWVE